MDCTVFPSKTVDPPEDFSSVFSLEAMSFATNSDSILSAIIRLLSGPV